MCYRRYFVPAARGAEALRALRALHARLAPLLQVSEVRAVAADSFWLSPSGARDSICLHFTWIGDEAAVREVLPAVEAALQPFGARPHWGKLFTMEPAAVAAQYPQMAEYRQALRQHDPDGKFRNEFVEKYVFSSE